MSILDHDIYLDDAKIDEVLIGYYPKYKVDFYASVEDNYLDWSKSLLRLC